MIKEDLSSEFLKDFLMVDPSGLKVLSAPVDPSQAELVNLGTTIKNILYAQQSI